MRRVLVPAILVIASLLSACDVGQKSTAIGQQIPAATPTHTTTASGRWPFEDQSAAAATSGEFDAAKLMKRNYYVVFDTSGSMSENRCSGQETKMDVAKRAFLAFAAKMPADTNLGLVVFDGHGGVRELIPLRNLDMETVRRTIAPINPNGGTPLGEAIRVAYGALTAQGRRQLGYGEYNLVVVTDGIATGEDPRQIVDTLLARSPIVLHTIGFCIGEKHPLNQPGRVVYRAADNPAQLAQGLAEVLAESPTFDATAFK